MTISTRIFIGILCGTFLVPQLMYAATPKESAAAIVARKNACLATAAIAREDSYTDGIQTYIQGLQSAVEARSLALKTIYRSKTGTELGGAAKNVFDTFTDAMNATRTAWIASQTATIASYKAAITACVNPPTPGAILFRDDFHRTNANATGNGWTDYLDGSGFTAGIKDNHWFDAWGQSGSNYVYRTDISQQSGIAITFQVQFLDSHASPFWIGTRQDTSLEGLRELSGYGLVISTTQNEIAINDHGSRKAVIPFTFNPTKIYQVEVSVTAAPQNWMDVYVWDIQAAKPIIPTVSWHNGGENYIPTSSGPAFIIGGTNSDASSEARGYLYQISTL